MTITIPENEPSEIVAGLSCHWRVKNTNYLWSDGYTFVYYLVKENKQISISGSDYGNNWSLFEVTSNVSSGYESGEYYYKLIAIKDDDKWPIKSGKIIISPDFIASSSGKDMRSHARITLDNIQKTIRSGSLKGEKSYSINGKSIERYTWDELIKAESRYKEIVLQEERAEEIKNGMGRNNSIYVRFVK